MYYYNRDWYDSDSLAFEMQMNAIALQQQIQSQRLDAHLMGLDMAQGTTHRTEFLSNLNQRMAQAEMDGFRRGMSGDPGF